MLRVVALAFVLLTFLLATGNALSQLQLLTQDFDASALQVTQVHTEAQTALLFGILSMLTVIAVGVLFPKAPAAATRPPVSTSHPPAQDSPAPPDTSRSS